MAMVNSIDINNGVMLRTYDMSVIKANEDNKPTIQQFDMMIEGRKEEDDRRETVQEADDTEKEDFKFDAKEEGRNKYDKKEGKKKKSSDSDEKGKDTFFIKSSRSSFDMSV